MGNGAEAAPMLLTKSWLNNKISLLEVPNQDMPQVSKMVLRIFHHLRPS